MHSQPHLHGSQRKPDRLLHPALLRRGRLRIELDPIISLHEPGKPVPRLGQGILLAETDARAGGERREGEPAPDRTTAVVGILPAFRAELQRVVAPEVGPPVHGVDVPEHLLALPDRDGAGPLRSAAHGQHGVPDRDAGVERDGLVEAQGLVEDVLDVPAGFQGGEVEGSGFRLLRGCHRGREGRRHETAELVAAGCVAAGEEDAEGLVSEFGFVLELLEPDTIGIAVVIIAIPSTHPHPQARKPQRAYEWLSQSLRDHSPTPLRTAAVVEPGNAARTPHPTFDRLDILRAS
ncbi:hypothetical protein KC360_g170 [Hortaea werneckii]|nr:hypothetical protein KC360_g170 [Hortaea werneckii]